MQLNLLCNNPECLHICSHTDCSCPNCEKSFLDEMLAIVTQDIATKKWINTGIGFTPTVETSTLKPHPLEDMNSLIYISAAAELVSIRAESWMADADRVGPKSKEASKLHIKYLDDLFWWSVNEFNSDDKAFVYLSIWLKTIYFNGNWSDKGAKWLSGISDLTVKYHFSIATGFGYKFKQDINIGFNEIKWELAQSIAPLLKNSVPVSLAYDNPVIDYLLSFLEKDESDEDAYKNYLAMNSAWKNT